MQIIFAHIARTLSEISLAADILHHVYCTVFKNFGAKVPLARVSATQYINSNLAQGKQNKTNPIED